MGFANKQEEEAGPRSERSARPGVTHALSVCDFWAGVSPGNEKVASGETEEASGARMGGLL